MTGFTDRATIYPRSRLWRLFKAFWRQKRMTPICPDTPRLDGQLALVTGGNSGIGLETARGLAQRGAEVIMAARNETSAQLAIERIASDFGVEAHYVRLDLADLDSVAAATDEIAHRWPRRRLDVIVANAGVWPTGYSQSAQGYEIAFATNVLGHHALIQQFIKRSLLADHACVVVLTGDIYILEKDCTPDFSYANAWRRQKAYCRSKLGNIWQARELARRYPDLQVNIVHPGVVASSLVGGTSGIRQRLSRAVLLSPENGAQTSLICATQPGLVNGDYYHNTMGRMIFHPKDPAADEQRASEFWEILEALVSLYL